MDVSNRPGGVPPQPGEALSAKRARRGEQKGGIRAWHLPRTGALVLFLMSQGCGVAAPPRGVTVSAPAHPVAVGAKYRFAVVDACTERGNVGEFLLTVGVGAALTAGGHPVLAIPPLPELPKCRVTRIDRITRATFDDPSVFRVTGSNVDQGGAVFEVEAIAQGKATFSIEVETNNGTYTAMAPFQTDVAARVDVDNVVGCAPGTDAVKPVGETSHAVSLFKADGGPLLGYGYLPIEVDGASVKPSPADGATVLIQWPRAGTFTVASSIDPSFRRSVRVVDGSNVTGLEVSATGAAIEVTGDPVLLSTVARMGGFPSCVEQELGGGLGRRKFKSETPEVCGFSTGGGPQSPEAVGPTAELRATAPGLCRVAVEVEGTPHQANLTLSVRDGWRALEPPPQPAVYYGIVATPAEITVVGGAQGEGTEKGRGVIATLRGSTWTRQVLATAKLNAIAGAGDVLFAVGDGGAIVQRSGSGPWVQVSSGTTEDLWAVAASDAAHALAVGRNGTIVMYDGTWRVTASGTTNALLAAAMPGSQVAWAVGDGRTALRWNGVAWSPVAIPVHGAVMPASANRFSAVGRLSPTDVCVANANVLFCQSGTTWSTKTILDNDITGFWTSGTELFAVGSCLGTDRQGDCTQVNYTSGTALKRRRLTANTAVAPAISAAGSEVVVLAGGDSIHRYR